jgi:hypothetical protein
MKIFPVFHPRLFYLDDTQPTEGRKHPSEPPLRVEEDELDGMEYTHHRAISIVSGKFNGR